MYSRDAARYAKHAHNGNLTCMRLRADFCSPLYFLLGELLHAIGRFAESRAAW